MKILLLTMLSGCGFLALVSAQTAADINEGARITYDPSNILEPYSFEFWGRPGYLYYIEETEDLATSWNYRNFAVIGAGAAESLDFNSTSGALFLRLRFTDDQNSELFLGDFDSDTISNYDEVLMGMSPFFDEGPLTLTGDEDGDGFLNKFDAAPYRASVGALNIAVVHPADGAVVD